MNYRHTLYVTVYALTLTLSAHASIFSFLYSLFAPQSKPVRTGLAVLLEEPNPHVVHCTNLHCMQKQGASRAHTVQQCPPSGDARHTHTGIAHALTPGTPPSAQHRSCCLAVVAPTDTAPVSPTLTVIRHLKRGQYQIDGAHNACTGIALATARHFLMYPDAVIADAHQLIAEGVRLYTPVHARVQARTGYTQVEDYRLLPEGMHSEQQLFGTTLDFNSVLTVLHRASKPAAAVITQNNKTFTVAYNPRTRLFSLFDSHSGPRVIDQGALFVRGTQQTVLEQLKTLYPYMLIHKKLSDDTETQRLQSMANQRAVAYEAHIFTYQGSASAAPADS